jgi:two-component system response regulator QseB
MHAETSAAIGVQTAQLEEQVSALNDALAQEDAKVAALRKKVGSDFIKNVRGVGYLVPA